MKELVLKKLIKLMPDILGNKNSEIRCPRCEKCNLEINNIEVSNAKVTTIHCKECGLYEEILRHTK